MQNIFPPSQNPNPQRFLEVKIIKKKIKMGYPKNYSDSSKLGPRVPRPTNLKSNSQSKPYHAQRRSFNRKQVVEREYLGKRERERDRKGRERKERRKQGCAPN